jgi:hypothetical protein
MDDSGEDATADRVSVGAGEFAADTKSVVFVPVLGYL